jgi:UDP-N-acetyl-D-galactosamine dehydrogenase
VVKVVSAQDPDTLDVMAQVYSLLAKAGVYKAPNIMTAESAKVIENIQRDLNIALMNELAMLFNQLGLDTQEVLKAARTKWNFLPFEPGLVGGECIPVNPYYLAHKAEAVGYHPEVILAGRRTNDGMGAFVAQETVKRLSRAGKALSGAKVLVLGLAFKENVRDIRNSRVIELVRELESFGCEVSVYDPVVGSDTVEELEFKSVTDPFTGESRYDAVVLAVSHENFPRTTLQPYIGLLRDESGPGVLIDVKGVLPRPAKDNSQVLYWSL